MDDLILVSVDDHVVEPADMFEGRVPKKYADQAPRFVHKDDGTDVWAYQGMELPNIGLNAVAGRVPEEYGMEPTALAEIRPGCYDIDSRIQDMNANGVLASMNFPSFVQFCGQLFLRTPDKDAAAAMVRAYNDWHIDEWSGTHPGRIIPVAIPMVWDAPATAQEVVRVAAKGCRAITFSENPAKLGLPSLHSDYWDPFWAACSDNGVILMLHIGSSSSMPITAADAPADVMIVLSPINIVQCAADLVFGPVLRKFPDLRVALSEGGIGWIPYFLERVDYVYKHHRAWTAQDFGNRLPSDVFRSQVVTCFIDDSFGVESRHHLNLDMIAWECDYPHSDSTWPRSPETLIRCFEGVPDDEIEKITYQNALRLWEFDPFKYISQQDATVGSLRSQAANWDTQPRSTSVIEWDGKMRTMADVGARLESVMSPKGAS